MSNELVIGVLVGFLAQLVDGALGLAYGVTASTTLLAFGWPPVAVSATVHTAETFTTGASALAHHAFGNVRKPLFWALVVPGVIGSVCGVVGLAQVDGERLRPWVSLYLVGMGVWIIVQALRGERARSPVRRVGPLARGGTLAAPLAAWLVRHLPARPLTGFVGVLRVWVGLPSAAGLGRAVFAQWVNGL